MDPDPNEDGGARTMTNLSPVPSFKVQNPKSPQSRANQTVGHWEAEGTAGKGSEVGLSGDSTERVPGGVMANTRAGDGAVGTPAQDRDPPGGAGRLLREHCPPGLLPRQGPGICRLAAASPEGVGKRPAVHSRAVL